MKYSHEQRTIDILLGDTELGRLVYSQFEKQKVEQIVRIIIHQEDIPKEKLSPFLQIYMQLISSGGDLDKVAYTLGDTTYAGVKSSVDPKKLLHSFGINIDAKGNYILQWNEEGQRQLEILDIERFQNYRDIYFNPPEDIFLNKIRANQSKEHVTNLEEELQMTNTPMAEAWRALAKQA